MDPGNSLRCGFWVTPPGTLDAEWRGTMTEPTDGLAAKSRAQVLKDEGPEFVQEMVLAAVRQGLAKSKELEEAERGKVTGKLGLPGLEDMI